MLIWTVILYVVFFIMVSGMKPSKTSIASTPNTIAENKEEEPKDIKKKEPIINNITNNVEIEVDKDSNVVNNITNYIIIKEK